MSTAQIASKVEKAFREIGLTEYETMAYISLVKTGEMTANDISSTTTIPYSKVYTVLDALEKKGWVEEKGGRPRRYYPKSPIESMRTEKIRQEKRFEGNRNLIVSELQALYEHREIKEKPEIWIIRGEENMVSKIRDVLENAKKELMVALPVVSQDLLRQFTPSLQEMLNKRISLQLLTTRKAYSTIPDFLVGMAEVRLRDDMFGGGIMADGIETLLFLSQDTAGEENLAIWSDHIGLNMVSKEYFKHLWETSEKV
ncbi:hypothetical protein A3K80_09295 [Candidatus Bathyarchaeota archaeon RBG_13_38_9]|nr:MAG: hypothetical protein A3K80_09295 [Candidatus Bathyarchaeota archaeon RBG_13_38_9]